MYSHQEFGRHLNIGSVGVSFGEIDYTVLSSSYPLDFGLDSRETNTICVSVAMSIAPIDFQLTQLFGEFRFPEGLKSECSSLIGLQIEADRCNRPVGRLDFPVLAM